MEEFATKAQRHEETQSGGICHEGTKTQRNTKLRFFATKAQRHEETQKRDD